MLTKFISRIVDVCLRFPRSVVIAGLLLAVLSGAYAATHFALDLRHRRAFVQGSALAPARLGVRDRVPPVPDHRRRARRADAPSSPPPRPTRFRSALKTDTAHFQSVTNSSAGDFFARNGLLFVPQDQFKASLDGIVKGGPLMTDLGQDPSLRGLTSVIEDVLIGVNQHRLDLAATAPAFQQGADVVKAILAGQPASFSWRTLASGHAPQPLGIARVSGSAPCARLQ